MTWAPWLRPLPDAALMRATDAWAIGERGVPSLELMERAGRGLARVVGERRPRAASPSCAAGNNGGDGLVAARLLREAGQEVDVLMTADPAALTGDPKANLERLGGAPPVPFRPAALAGAEVIVDALLGTGFGGEPREPARGAIEAMAAARVPVIAADVPSGVDASTGEVAGAAVRAAATATFHQGKPGLWIAPGKACAGEVVTPSTSACPDGGPGPAAAGLLAPAVLAGVPRRGGGASTKFTSGTVVVVGAGAGSPGAHHVGAGGDADGRGLRDRWRPPASAQLAFSIRPRSRR